MISHWAVFFKITVELVGSAPGTQRKRTENVQRRLVKVTARLVFTSLEHSAHEVDLAQTGRTMPQNQKASTNSQMKHWKMKTCQHPNSFFCFLWVHVISTQSWFLLMQLLVVIFETLLLFAPKTVWIHSIRSPSVSTCRSSPPGKLEVTL